MLFKDVEFECAYGRSAQLPASELPEIVFSGRSNVGKSSMINKIFGRKHLARVSATPGKTTTINFYKAGDVRFADMPGYGYARRSMLEKKRWGELAEGYFSGDRRIVLIVQLIDSRHCPTADDMLMIDFMKRKKLPFIVVLTKIDKLSKKQLGERLEALALEAPDLDGITIVPFSAQTGEGAERIREIMASTISV